MKNIIIILSLFVFSVGVFADIPDYDRKEFGSGWTDEDGDCENTRAEVLKRDAVWVFAKNDKTCMPTSGFWVGKYSGKWVMKARKLDVDHIVPLKHAWVAGAWKWSKERRIRFANDMDNLIAVTARQNRSKGSKSPQEWLPPKTSAKCFYLDRWVIIKRIYGLDISANEYFFIKQELQDC